VWLFAFALAGAHARAEEDPLLAGFPPAAEKLESFEQALNLLQAHNSDLRIQTERVRQAEADSRAELARVLPSLAGQLTAEQNVLHPGQNSLGRAAGTGATGTGAGSSIGVLDPDEEESRPTHVLGVGTLSATLPLIDVPAWYGISSARASERAADWTLEDLHRTLVRDLSRRLITALAAERLAEIERAALLNAQERMYLTRRSFELGASNRLDVVRLEQDYAVSRGDVIRANEAVRNARENLGLLLGRPSGLGVAPGFKLAGLPEQARSVCRPLEGLEARADLRAQRSLIEAAQRRVGEQTAQYLPTLGLQSQVFAFTAEPGPIEVPTWSIAAVLQFNFWDGGGRGAARNRAQSQQREAEEQALLVERTARIEVAQARRGIDVARERMVEAENARDLAREADRLTRRAFEVGRGNSLDLVQSATTFRQAELNLALREYDLAFAVVDGFTSISSCRLDAAR
jgi:multidrug efflux system outer membrane protein